MTGSSLLLSSMLLGAASVCSAQQKMIAEKIIGIVGDKVILRSELDIAAQDIIRNNNGQEVKEVDKCSILDNMLFQKVLVLQAERDSLPIRDEEVEAEIDQRLKAFKGLPPTTIQQLKQDFFQPVRQQRLAQAMYNGIIEGITVSPAEVKGYFERTYASNPRFYEANVELRQLAIYPKTLPVTDAAIASTTTLLDSVRQLLIAGTISFREAAAQYGVEKTVSQSTIDQFKKSNLKPGEYSQPAVFTDDSGKKGARIILIVSRSKPHIENLKDDYQKIAERALEQKRSVALEKWFAFNLPSLYIMIDEEYRSCSNLSKWLGTASTTGN
ncbi:hypothetical protein Q4E93_23245 [Flavitalea sp. BT771]|uniref:hypothetical protein n=1 Tax=Flavitalea sp. BT771 TaxID=3063329 RepID=UPI0026E277B1|nr:hypothetical protein [Flavitalea sp. BT771]MDO6433547.1 hypothetical protein [Flavitalea sp. BT771]MDV6222548.1 hypothetical protein [Flavitalea sp. BT771]